MYFIFCALKAFYLCQASLSMLQEALWDSWQLTVQSLLVLWGYSLVTAIMLNEFCCRREHGSPNLGITFFRSTPLVIEIVIKWLDKRHPDKWDQMEFKYIIESAVDAHPELKVQVRPQDASSKTCATSRSLNQPYRLWSRRVELQQPPFNLADKDVKSINYIIESTLALRLKTQFADGISSLWTTTICWLPDLIDVFVQMLSRDEYPVLCCQYCNNLLRPLVRREWGWQDHCPREQRDKWIVFHATCINSWREVKGVEYDEVITKQDIMYMIKDLKEQDKLKSEL